MSEHPISDLFKISMNSIKEIIDVDTVVGDTVKINDRVSIIPISKVKCSFATGGTDQKNNQARENMPLPFGGATGGTVTISPVAFLVIAEDVKLLHIDDNIHLYEMLIDQIPEVVNYVRDVFKKQPKIKDIEIIERK